MSKRKKIIVAAAALLAILAGVGIYLYFSSDGKATPRYDTASADRGRIVAKVTATGSLSALVTVQVGSQVSGRLQQIFVDFNSPVKKGEVLAKIDPQLFEAALQQAQANDLAAQGLLTKSKVQAEDARRQYERAQSLAEKNLIAQQDLDTAKAAMDAALAQVQASQGALAQAEAALRQARVNLGYTTIVSPIDGMVISRNVDVGQTVAASLQAPVLFTIAEDLRKMQVDTSVAEADVGKLSAGMKTSFSVDAYPLEKFEGTVRQIRNAPQSVQNVVTYDAVIDVANPDFKLKPGMTANVTFIYGLRDDVLRVPNAALRFKPPPSLTKTASAGNGIGRSPGAPLSGGGGKRQGDPPGASGENDPGNRTVWVLRGGEASPEKVRLGLSDGSFTEVVEGNIKEGESIITDAHSATAPASRGLMPPGGGGMRRMF